MSPRDVLRDCGCTPEPPTLAVTVQAEELYGWTYKRVWDSPVRELLIDQWAKQKLGNDPETRARYGVQSVAIELLTAALDGPLAGTPGEPLLTWRNHDGERPWRVPRKAFETGGGFDLEPTWTVGRLHQICAPDRYQPLAWLQLPLLTTEAEAEGFKQAVASLTAGGRDAAAYERQDPGLSERGDLLERARMGELTADQAEAEAERLGIGPLAERPDPSRFDPREEPFWTFPMLMAWLLWHDADEVRWQMAAYRESSLDWQPTEKGWVLEQVRPRTSTELLIRAVHRAAKEGRDGNAMIESAWADLRRKLAGDRVKAIAVPRGGHLSKPVPAHEWPNLEIRDSDTSRGDQLRERGQEHNLLYDRGLLFNSDDVLREWPPRRAQPGASSLETPCREWLAEMMKASPKVRTIRKADAQLEASKKFKDSKGNSISDKAFGRAWDGAIEEANALAWKRGGAPKRNPDPRNHSAV